MPFIAQVSEKQPWVLFNVPVVPRGTEKLVVKAKMFPTAFAVKQVRVEPGKGTDPRPPGWQAPVSPGERMKDVGRALGTGMIAGGLAGLLALLAIVALAIWLVPKALKYL